jgi:hypothetical protein
LLLVLAAFGADERYLTVRIESEEDDDGGHSRYLGGDG